MNYPHTIAEVIDDAMTYPPETLAAFRNFKATYPYRGKLAERKVKFATLHAALCGIYNKKTTLNFRLLDGKPSDNSSYCRSSDAITLRGRLSVVTYLHEFAHALLGRDERNACRWSLSLFARFYPRSFARCLQQGHVLRVSR